MKRLYYKIISSFSLRLSLYILTVSSIVFVVAFSVNIKSARNNVKIEAFDKAQNVLHNTALQIDNVLSLVETAVRNVSWLVYENLDDPDYLYSLTERVLKSNPFVFGSAIAFEPYYYKEKGMFFSPFSYRESGKILSKQLGSVDYDYHYMDWYQIPKLLGTPYWSEPYYDDGGANEIISTFSFPLYDNDGKLFAVFTADISLQWFARKVNSMKIYPNSRNYMIGRGGTFLVHPNDESILNESLFATALYSNDKKLLDIAHKMTSLKTGMGEFDDNNQYDEEYFLFYAPITSTGWSVFVSCTHSDILASMDKMTLIISIMAILGLLLMTGLCYIAIKKLTNPLVHFTTSAREIADGNFNASLPDIKTEDEMHTLCNSFKDMQLSLVDYISQLKETTANTERIESELRIARNIQEGMVPKIFPPFPHREDIDLYAILKPAREVGGDLYDFFLKGDKLYFMIGDVSGKGVPASLVMAVSCRLFRTVSSHVDSAQGIVSALNDTLADKNESNMFCTAFVGILNLASGVLEYCNAGHNAPVIACGGEKAEFLDVVPNLPLGLFEGFEYQGQSCTLKKGSSLLLYTDGITEAENVEKELYSDDRMLELIEGCAAKGASDICESLVADVEKHSNGAQQSDDITLLCLKYMQVVDKELVMFNRVSEIDKLPAFIEEVVSEGGLPAELVFNFNLALEEAVSNVILYAYPKDEEHSLSLRARIAQGTITFVLSDSGKPFDPTVVKDADVSLSAQERGIGGLGIFLVRQIMDSVEYCRKDDMNILTLNKLI